MEYKQIIAKLSYLKSEGEILDYNIDSRIIVIDGHSFVESKLVIFNQNGKPTVTTGLAQGQPEEVNIDTLQERAVEIAYLQNPIRGELELTPTIC